jgi:hypothetical protein
MAGDSGSPSPPTATCRLQARFTGFGPAGAGFGLIGAGLLAIGAGAAGPFSTCDVQRRYVQKADMTPYSLKS